MTHEPLTVALVGCGRMGAFTSEGTRTSVPPCWLPLSHAEAVEAVDGLSLVALAEVDATRRNDAGERFGVPSQARYADAAEMLAAVRPDIAAIATRSDVRAATVEAALAAGVRGIHAEKPFAPRLGDTERLLSRMERDGVAFTFGTVRRFMPAYRRARELLADGAIGTLREVAVDFGAGQLLLWTLPHAVDLLLGYGGSSPESVCGRVDIPDGAVSGETIDADPAVRFARVRFADGVEGAITAAGGMDVRLSGTAGTIRVLSDGAALELARPSAPGGAYLDRVERVPVAQAPSGTQAAFMGLRDAIRGTGPMPMPHGDVVLGQRILGAIVVSSLDGGRETPLAAVPSGLTITGRYRGNVA
ncbi:Gfo/Idh/MocA family protein [Salinarimonas chemoclinalis]|uniref:Gfo/Idh/MocA family protein n=1 Tax=Salinarimonas chemoclinalis TaxID=3241599 RepID=UPI0035579FB6